MRPNHNLTFSLKTGLAALLLLFATVASAGAGESYLSPTTKYLKAEPDPAKNCLIGVFGVTQTQNGCEVCFDPNIFLSPGTSLVSVTWNFGNGATSNLEEPCHTFGAPGTYNVTLTLNAINGTQACSCTHNIEVIVDQCCPCDIEPDFTYCVEDCEVCFFPTAGDDTCEVRYTWLFGDGSTSTDPEPCHVFPIDGQYEVCLVVTPDPGGEDCNDTICKTVCVVGCETDTCECQVSNFMIFANPSGCSVGFTATLSVSANCFNETITWDFGDGTIATLPIFAPPTHVYSGPGPWTVCASVTGEGTQTGCIDEDIADCLTFTLDCIVQVAERQSGPDADPDPTHRQKNTGINQDLRLFPNPTGDLLNIEYPWAENEKVKIEVINSSGKIMLELPSVSAQEKVQVDVSEFAAGTYYVRMTDADNHQSFNIFIKQ